MTRLGTSEEAKRSGRYAALMGTWWRHPKRQKLGRAAAGLFTDMLSFCADQGVDRLTERQFALIAGRDPNVRRQLKELLAADLVQTLDGEYLVHDWYQHNRVAKPVKLRAVPSNDQCAQPTATRLATRDATRLATRLVMNAPPEIIQESPSPRARASTQDPGPRREEPPTGVQAAAPPTPPSAPRKARAKDPHKATLKRVLEETCAERGVLAAGALTLTQLAATAKKAREYAEREGIEFEAAARRICGEAADAVKRGSSKALCWALKDWQPGVRLQGAARRSGPLPCGSHEEFSVPGVYEAQMARMRELQREHAARKAAGHG